MGKNGQCKDPEVGASWAPSKERKIIVAGVLKEDWESRQGAEEFALYSCGRNS